MLVNFGKLPVYHLALQLLGAVPCHPSVTHRGQEVVVHYQYCTAPGGNAADAWSSYHIGDVLPDCHPSILGESLGMRNDAERKTAVREALQCAKSAYVEGHTEVLVARRIAALRRSRSNAAPAQLEYWQDFYDFYFHQDTSFDDLTRHFIDEREMAAEANWPTQPGASEVEKIKAGSASTGP